MVVKEKRGRRRYIAFEVLSDTPLNLAELKSILRNEAQHYGMEPPKVIQFENQRGIVRCPHTEKEKNVELSVIGKDKPLQVKEKLENMVIVKLLAPYVEDEQ